MGVDYGPLVQALVIEADRRAAEGLGEKLNKGEALAQVLAEKANMEYKPASVRSWMRGDSMPPADVLLAVARTAGISIDEMAGRQEGAEGERLEALEGQVASLKEVVSKLQEELARQRRELRLAWAEQSSEADQPAPQAPVSRSAGRSLRP